MLTLTTIAVIYLILTIIIIAITIISALHSKKPNKIVAIGMTVSVLLFILFLFQINMTTQPNSKQSIIYKKVNKFN